MTFSIGTLLNTFIFILYFIQKNAYIPSATNVTPVSSHIFIRSTGSDDIPRTISVVPTIPIIGMTGPPGTLKLLGTLGSLLRMICHI